MVNEAHTGSSSHTDVGVDNGKDTKTTVNMSANMSADTSADTSANANATLAWNTGSGAGQPSGTAVCGMKRTVSGFSLIELLIAIAIVGIIAAIAVPSYSIYITKANRTDAMNFLIEAAGEQQRYFSENNTYASKMSELDYGSGATYPSPEEHYTISVTNANGAAKGYVLSATPVAGGRQAGDDECKVFTISSTGAKANTGGSNSNCW